MRTTLDLTPEAYHLAKAASIFSTKSVEGTGVDGVPNHKLIGKTSVA